MEEGDKKAEENRDDRNIKPLPHWDTRAQIEKQDLKALYKQLKLSITDPYGKGKSKYMRANKKLRNSLMKKLQQRNWKQSSNNQQY